MLKNYTFSLDAKEMELFRLKHTNVSEALRKLIRDDVNPLVTKEVQIDQEQVFTDPKPFTCPHEHSKYKDMIVRSTECDFCHLSCSSRLTD